MAMKRCDNGHFYDGAKHVECPYCGFASMEVPKTAAISSDEAERNGGVTVGYTAAPQMQGINNEADVPVPKTMPLSPDREKTIGIMQKKKGIDPVVGWLVCVEGELRGKDYRIRPERNFIGRSPSMDICISEDRSISKENHAVISFDAKNCSFALFPGDTRGILYLNDEEVLIAKEIKKGDIIEIGKTKLKFIPFCEDGFVWQ